MGWNYDYSLDSLRLHPTLTSQANELATALIERRNIHPRNEIWLAPGTLQEFASNGDSYLGRFLRSPVYTIIQWLFFQMLTADDEDGYDSYWLRRDEVDDYANVAYDSIDLPIWNRQTMTDYLENEHGFGYVIEWIYDNIPQQYLRQGLGPFWPTANLSNIGQALQSKPISFIAEILHVCYLVINQFTMIKGFFAGWGSSITTEWQNRRGSGYNFADAVAAFNVSDPRYSSTVRHGHFVYKYSSSTYYIYRAQRTIRVQSAGQNIGGFNLDYKVYVKLSTDSTWATFINIYNNTDDGIPENHTKLIYDDTSDDAVVILDDDPLLLADSTAVEPVNVGDSVGWSYAFTKSAAPILLVIADGKVPGGFEYVD